MKKNIALILVFCVMIAVFCGCSSFSSYEEADVNPDNCFSKGYFTVIKSWDGGFDTPSEYIVYANDTGVMYYVFLWPDCFGIGGITPLYNADGTLQIYEGE